MSLDERAFEFMAQFPGKKLAPKRLSQIYKAHMVRKKKVRFTKILNRN